MIQSDIHLVFQQLGQVLSGIRGLHDTINIRQAQAEQLHDLVRSDLATLRHDHRQLEEKFACVLLIAQRDMEVLRANSRENSSAISTLIASIETLRKPMSQLAALKSKAAGLLFGAWVVGSCALWLAEPIYRGLVDLFFQQRSWP